MIFGTVNCERTAVSEGSFLMPSLHFMDLGRRDKHGRRKRVNFRWKIVCIVSSFLLFENVQLDSDLRGKHFVISGVNVTIYPYLFKNFN